MANFIYKALDPQTQKQISVNISANNRVEANRLIIDRGYRPLSVKETKEGLNLLKRRIKRKDKILFTTQLSTLISAGLPLLQALKTSADQTTHKELKKIILEVIGSIEGGISFSESLSKYPDTFDSIFINLIRAGEASGTLDTSLERLAVQQEKDGELVSKIKNAMIYPIIVMVVMIGLVVFMLLFVLPKVQDFYAGLPDEAELPLITQMLVAVSDIIKNFWYLIILAAFGVVGAIGWWVRTPAGAQTFDRFKLTVPMIKNLYQRVYMARYCRTVGTLFGSGVNLLQTLDIMKKGINNVHMEASIGRSIGLIQEGNPLSQSLSNEEYFLDLVPDMIRIGEQSGKTEDMLLKAAIYYEKEVDKQIKALTTIMEPLMILLLGGIAVTIVLAILLPLYTLVNKSLT